MTNPDDQTLRVLTWNVERKKPTSPRGAEAVDYLFSLEPDVMAITEARTTFPESGGHTLWCEPPRGSTFAEDERKVLIWSKEPWTDVDRFGVDGLDQTRFIAATTQTSIGKIRFIGVCIPWHMAEVTYPIDVKRKPWELHIKYLELLRDVIEGYPEPTIVAGDFNQHVPRQKGGRIDAAEALDHCFENFSIITSGQIEGATRPGIDHIAIDSSLQASSVWGWPHDVNGQRLSDHDGAGAVLRRASRSQAPSIGTESP